MRIKLPVALIISLLPAVASFSADSSGSRPVRADALNSLSPQIEAQPRQDRKRAAKQRRKKSAGAPLVDSALLRFISTQKKQQRQRQLASDNNLEQPQTDLAIFVDSLEPKGVTEPTTVGDSRLNQEWKGDFERQGEVPKNASSSAITGDDLDPWMGQFNRNRVAQKLISVGASEAAAQFAGEKVQSLILVRTARRRIRDFLRERDSLWNAKDGATAIMESRLQQKRKEKKFPATRPNYRFDDVVDLLCDYGLTGTDICTILTHSPSVAVMMPRRSDRSTAQVDYGSGGETLEDTMDRSFTELLMTTLKLRRYDARKVLRGTPGLLSKRGSRSATQVVAMLSQIGVSASSIGRNKVALPMLLSRSPSGLFRLVSFLSSHAIRMPVKQIGPLMRRAESLELLDAVVPVPRLRTDNSNGKNTMVPIPDNDTETDPEVAEALLGRASEIRQRTIAEQYKKMASTAWTLRNEIGTKDLGKVVSAYPSVLLLDADKQILPVAKYLMDELGICEGDLPSVLQLYPVLLGKDISKMREVASFLLWVEVEPENLASIFRSFPVLLTLDVERDMMPVVEFLQRIGISNIGRFVTRLPPVLGYSVEKELLPKWKYLNEVCMYSSFELSRFPAYFSYPFERVIKTRYEYLATKQFSTDIMPVDTILRFGDKDFAAKVARDDDGGKRFREFADQRKKANTNLRKQQRLRPKTQQPKNAESS